MSSLAATQADGYYIPSKHFDNDKRIQHKSKNEIARKGKGGGGHNQFLQRGVCRFELPYRGTCQQCQQPIMKGTRFNARKTKVDAYFTTPIYEFRMKCPSCKGPVEFVIRTNPKELSFDYVSGISKRLLEPLEEELDDGSRYVVLSDGEGGSKSVLDRLERQAASERKALSEREHLEHLMRQSNTCYKNDSSRNASLRDSYRVVRRKRKQQRKAGQAAGWKQGMELLSDDQTSDIVLSKSVTFQSKEGDLLRKKRESSIFSSQARKMKKTLHSSQSERGESAGVVPEDVPSHDRLEVISSSDCTLPQLGDRPYPASPTRELKTKKLMLQSDGSIQRMPCPSQEQDRPMIACLALYGSDSDVDSS